MYVDSDNVIISNEISTLPTSFNLNESLFIGGIKDSSKINKNFKINNGLHGAIQIVNIIDL